MENTTNPNWSNAELKAYVLLYCANADFIETEEEIEMIKSKIKEDEFKGICKEFYKDNDYQRIQKIKICLEKHFYSKEEIDSLYNEMMELFFSDGDYSTLEKNIYLGLKHLLG